MSRDRNRSSATMSNVQIETILGMLLHLSVAVLPSLFLSLSLSLSLSLFVFRLEWFREVFVKGSHDSGQHVSWLASWLASQLASSLASWLAN